MTGAGSGDLLYNELQLDRFFAYYTRLEVHATLNDVRTKNRRDDGDDDLKDLLNGIPFNHKVIFLKLYNIFAGLHPAGNSYFLWRRERSKETSTPYKLPPIWGSLNKNRGNRRFLRLFRFLRHNQEFGI